MTAPARPLALPRDRPEGYRPLEREPRFDPSRHLALEPPACSWSLEEFGYDADAIAATPSPVAAAGPFRLLSEEGAAAAREVCAALRDEGLAGGVGLRTGAFAEGAVYRSAFLRDLCDSPEAAAFVSEIAATALAPHSLPSQRLYVNFAPEDLSQAVDNWHVDSIGFDYVLMASDPAPLKGGRLQVFRGALADAARLLDTTTDGLTEGFADDLPPDLVETVDFPGAGWAFFLQGHLVLHRATRLETPGERISLVAGYVAADAAGPDPTRVERIAGYGEPGVVAELARHAAWRSAARLERLTETLPMTDDPSAVVAALGEATADVARLVAALDGKD